MDIYIAAAKRGDEVAYGAICVDKKGHTFDPISRKSSKTRSGSRAVGAAVYDMLRRKKHQCMYDMHMNDNTMLNALGSGKTRNYTDVYNAVSDQIAKYSHNVTFTKCDCNNEFYIKARELARKELEK